MSPTDISRVTGVAGVRQDNAAQARLDAATIDRTPSAAAPVTGRPGAASDTAPEINVSAASTSAATTPPVDSNRVTEIREAIQSGNYPLLPAKIADAMIAAPFLLGNKA